MKLITLLIFAFIGGVGFTQTSTIAPFSADYISINQSGEVWAFGEGAKNGKGLYYDFNGWNFVEYNLSDGVTAASSVYGEILIVNNKGGVAEWNSNNKRWIPYQGVVGAKDAFISKKNGNNKYVLGDVVGSDGVMEFGLWKVANIAVKASDWQAVAVGDPLVKFFIKATNDKVGNLYFVTSDGKLYTKTESSNSYSGVNTSGRFAVDVLVGDDDELYMMERGGGIYKKVGSNWTSCKLSATSFGVDNKGYVYGTVNGEIQVIKNGQMSKITLNNPNKLDQNGNTTITAAVIAQNPTALNKAISDGANVNAPNASGEYPIILAAQKGHLEMVNILIQNKAEVDLMDRTKHTALYYTVLYSNVSVAQSLLIGKANANAEDYVSMAVSAKDDQMILLLSSYKADLNPGLTKAADMDDIDRFNQLVNLGAKDENNKAFEIATNKNNLEMVQLCLENGADEDQAILYAFDNSNKEVMIKCLDAGADPTHAITFCVQNNDVELANDLINKYGVNANTLLENALPGAKSKPTSQEGTNLTIASVALANGAKADNYFDYAVQSKNTPLIEILLMNGGDSNKLLAAAVENNDVENVSFAFDNGADPLKNTSLFLAAIEKDQSEIAIIFIDRGAPVTDSRLIKAAVEKSNENITKILLEHGAPVTNTGLIATAVANDQEGIVQDLLNFGADPNTAIVPAIEKNATKMVLMMLDAGAEARTPELISKSAGLGNIEIATALLEKGAQPDDGVLSSIYGGHLEMFNLLMDNGADNNNIDFVVAAVRYDRTTMFNRLVDNGAPLAYTGSNQENLLHISVKNGNYEITEVLLKQGVDVNQKNDDGSTPLHIAANNGRNNVEMCSLLVNNGGNVNAIDNKGKSVLKVADGKKLKDYLKSKGAEK